MKRRLKLTITKIRRGMKTEEKAVFQMLCPICFCEVEMLTAGEAAALLETGNLDDLIKAGKIHTALTVSGSWRICKRSLFQ